MEPSSIDRAAAAIAAVRLARRPLAPLPAALRPPDEAAAYAVQDALHARLQAAGRGPLAGWKIGCTTAVMQRYLGIANPCAGGIFRATVHDREATVEAGDVQRLGVECEIAVRLASPLPAPGAPADREHAHRAVGACFAAIELVEDRYEDYRRFDTPILIADDFFGAGCVLGPPVEHGRLPDLAGVGGRMLVNGEEAGSGRGADILGHPLAALVWLARSLAARGRRLEAGDLVLLGSLVQTVWLAPGDRVAVELEGLGGAALRLR